MSLEPTPEAAALFLRRTHEILAARRNRLARGGEGALAAALADSLEREPKFEWVLDVGARRAFAEAWPDLGHEIERLLNARFDQEERFWQGLVGARVKTERGEVSLSNAVQAMGSMEPGERAELLRRIDAVLACVDWPFQASGPSASDASRPWEYRALMWALLDTLSVGRSYSDLLGLEYSRDFGFLLSSQAPFVAPGADGLDRLPNVPWLPYRRGNALCEADGTPSGVIRHLLAVGHASGRHPLLGSILSLTALSEPYLREELDQAAPTRRRAARAIGGVLLGARARSVVSGSAASVEEIVEGWKMLDGSGLSEGAARMWLFSSRASSAVGEGSSRYDCEESFIQELCGAAAACFSLRDAFDEDWWRNPRLEFTPLLLERESSFGHEVLERWIIEHTGL